MARSWSPPWPARRCRSTPSSSAAASAPATMRCAAALTVRGSCSNGRMRAPRSWATIRREALERGGGTLSEAEEEKIKAPIREQFERQGHPYYASARLWDDGVIDPADTRRMLGLGLSAAMHAPIEPTKFGI